MIVEEFLNNDTLVRHYSDAGMMMLQNETGLKYGEAIDVVPCPFTYTETDEPVEVDEEATEGETESVDPEEATEEDYQNSLSEFGVVI